MKDYYSVLEINESASVEVIEKVHKLLVKKYHPDLQNIDNKKVAEEKMKEINEAYEVLTNPEKKHIYDVKLKEYKIQEIVNQIKSDCKDKDNISTNNRHINNKEIKKYNDTTNQKEHLDEEEIRRLAQIYYEELYNAYNIANGYYKEPFKEKARRFFSNIIAVILVVLIIYGLFQVPFIRNYVLDIIDKNEITKTIFDRIIKK